MNEKMNGATPPSQGFADAIKKKSFRNIFKKETEEQQSAVYNPYVQDETQGDVELSHASLYDTPKEYDTSELPVAPSADTLGDEASVEKQIDDQDTPQGSSHGGLGTHDTSELPVAPRADDTLGGETSVEKQTGDQDTPQGSSHGGAGARDISEFPITTNRDDILGGETSLKSQTGDQDTSHTPPPSEMPTEHEQKSRESAHDTSNLSRAQDNQHENGAKQTHGAHFDVQNLEGDVTRTNDPVENALSPLSIAQNDASSHVTDDGHQKTEMQSTEPREDAAQASAPQGAPTQSAPQKDAQNHGEKTSGLSDSQKNEQHESHRQVNHASDNALTKRSSHLTQMELGHKQFENIKHSMPGLGRPLTLLEGDFPKGSRLSIGIISVMVACFVAWASVTPIKEVAVARGEIIPTNFVKTVQHLEGGIVKQLLVEEGSLVKKGQVLLRMDEAAALSELDQIRARQTALLIKSERLRAVGMQEKPKFDQFDPDFQNLIDDQQTTYTMQMKNWEDQRLIIQKQLDQKKATLSVQEGRIQDLEQRAEVLRAQRDVLKTLYDKRLKTRTEYVASEDLLNEVLVDLNGAKNSLLETRQSMGEFESRLLETDTRLRNEALTERTQVTSELAEIEELKMQLEDRVRRLEVKAPAAGIVKGLKNTTLRGVVQPGAEILQIVPNEILQVEGKLNPKDTGKLSKGQEVLVKVTAFDYSRYGGIKGKVSALSGTTFMDERENTSYYKVFIDLEKNFVGQDPSKHNIIPGMEVQADIITDKKTLIQYLMKPVYNAFSESFGEQ